MQCICIHMRRKLNCFIHKISISSVFFNNYFLDGVYVIILVILLAKKTPKSLKIIGTLIFTQTTWLILNREKIRKTLASQQHSLFYNLQFHAHFHFFTWIWALIKCRELLSLKSLEPSIEMAHMCHFIYWIMQYQLRLVPYRHFYQKPYCILWFVTQHFFCYICERQIFWLKIDNFFKRGISI